MPQRDPGSLLLAELLAWQVVIATQAMRVGRSIYLRKWPPCYVALPNVAKSRQLARETSRKTGIRTREPDKKEFAYTVA